VIQNHDSRIANTAPSWPSWGIRLARLCRAPSQRTPATGSSTACPSAVGTGKGYATACATKNGPDVSLSNLVLFRPHSQCPQPSTLWRRLSFGTAHTATNPSRSWLCWRHRKPLGAPSPTACGVVAGARGPGGPARATVRSRGVLAGERLSRRPCRELVHCSLTGRGNAVQGGEGDDGFGDAFVDDIVADGASLFGRVVGSLGSQSIVKSCAAKPCCALAWREVSSRTGVIRAMPSSQSLAHLPTPASPTTE
jgi:hypothetical protein